MFNFFKKKTPLEIEQQEIIKAFNTTAKEIKKHKGMYVEVCMDFANYVKSDELFSATGLIWDKHCPHSKIKIGQASLMLLAALKNDVLQDREDNFLYDLAKFSFTRFNLILNTEEMQPLLGDLDLMRKTKEERLSVSEKMWVDWENTEPSTLKAAACL